MSFEYCLQRKRRCSELSEQTHQVPASRIRLSSKYCHSVSEHKYHTIAALPVCQINDEGISGIQTWHHAVPCHRESNHHLMVIAASLQPFLFNTNCVSCFFTKVHGNFGAPGGRPQPDFSDPNRVRSRIGPTRFRNNEHGIDARLLHCQHGIFCCANAWFSARAACDPLKCGVACSSQLSKSLRCRSLAANPFQNAVDRWLRHA